MKMLLPLHVVKCDSKCPELSCAYQRVVGDSDRTWAVLGLVAACNDGGMVKCREVPEKQVIEQCPLISYKILI